MTIKNGITKSINKYVFGIKTCMLTFAMALFGQIPILRHCPFTILVVPIPGTRIRHTPPIQGNATLTVVIQLQ